MVDSAACASSESIQAAGRRRRRHQRGQLSPGRVRRGSLSNRLNFFFPTLKISRALDEVITRFKPDACAIEEAFLATNPKVTLKLGQVRRVALLAAESAALEVGEYSPRSIKQTVAGYGNADKHQVQEMVRRLLSLPLVSDRTTPRTRLRWRSATFIMRE